MTNDQARRASSLGFGIKCQTIGIAPATVVEGRGIESAPYLYRVDLVDKAGQARFAGGSFESIEIAMELALSAADAPK